MRRILTGHRQEHLGADLKRNHRQCASASHGGCRWRPDLLGIAGTPRLTPRYDNAISGQTFQQPDLRRRELLCSRRPHGRLPARCLEHRSPTALRAASADEPLTHRRSYVILNTERVVYRKLSVDPDRAQGPDKDAAGTLLRHAIRLARMVDPARRISHAFSVDDATVRGAKQERATVAQRAGSRNQKRLLRVHALAPVFQQNLACAQVTPREQPATQAGRPAHDHARDALLTCVHG
jgi:hypothetical protein